MTLGDKLRTRRLELGLTLEEVGSFVGVGKSTVRKWEQGYIANMRRDRIALLASVLKMNPSELILDDSDASTTDVPEEEYLLAARSKNGKQAVRRLTKKQYEIASALIDSLELNEDENL